MAHNKLNQIAFHSIITGAASSKCSLLTNHYVLPNRERLRFKNITKWSVLLLSFSRSGSSFRKQKLFSCDFDMINLHPHPQDFLQWKISIQMDCTPPDTSKSLTRFQRRIETMSHHLDNTDIRVPNLNKGRHKDCESNHV